MVKPVFIKAQGASLSASFIDFSTTVLLVEVFGCPKVIAAAAGTIVGGIFNFLLGRYWVFKSSKKRAHIQAGKYLLIWAGSFLLNTGGVVLMVHGLAANYIFSKVLVSVIVGFTYNYQLQKKYVFKH